MLWGRRSPPTTAQSPAQRSESELHWWAPPLPAPRLPIAEGADHRLGFASEADRSQQQAACEVNVLQGCTSGLRAACSLQAERQCSPPTLVRLLGLARDGSTAGGPIGHLLVATAAGQLVSLPVGTPRIVNGEQQQQQQQQQQQLGGAAQQRVLVCYSSSGIHFLRSSGSSSAAAGSQQSQHLLLLAESGQLMSAAESGLDGSETVAIAAGRGSHGGLLSVQLWDPTTGWQQ
ncbi:hypothetical protein C2E21_2652 [Chlorella sorokiniana]|uniref:Uncharacterized protein n=1 Tax=Chlorella sorokiniana TaxID=3076 RepID=A0A2P6TYS5_CHLSO|nr:hypothetical protein C2E21_2652 [Chlorella sorokiniana]|eukprot:PRW59209.1 hypothetical protein C2E21_2652 [Chlorella sorokiniana]